MSPPVSPTMSSGANNGPLKPSSDKVENTPRPLDPETKPEDDKPRASSPTSVQESKKPSSSHSKIAFKGVRPTTAEEKLPDTSTADQETKKPSKSHSKVGGKVNHPTTAGKKPPKAIPDATPPTSPRPTTSATKPEDDKPRASTSTADQASKKQSSSRPKVGGKGPRPTTADKKLPDIIPDATPPSSPPNTNGNSNPHPTTGGKGPWLYKSFEEPLEEEEEAPVIDDDADEESSEDGSPENDHSSDGESGAVADDLAEDADDEDENSKGSESPQQGSPTERHTSIPGNDAAAAGSDVEDDLSPPTPHAHSRSCSIVRETVNKPAEAIVPEASQSPIPTKAKPATTTKTAGIAFKKLNLMQASVADLRHNLTCHGLEVEGTKEVLRARLILHERCLDEETYSERCRALLKLSLDVLLLRLNKDLNIKFKSQSKVAVAGEILEAEAKLADLASEPATSASRETTPGPSGNGPVQLKPGTKRSRDDDADISDGDEQASKRMKASESLAAAFTPVNKVGLAALKSAAEDSGSASLPKPTVSKTKKSYDSGMPSSGGLNKSTKRKHTEDAGESSQVEDGTSKRPKLENTHPSSLDRNGGLNKSVKRKHAEDPAESSQIEEGTTKRARLEESHPPSPKLEKASTSQPAKAPTRRSVNPPINLRKTNCDDFPRLNSELESRILFENKPTTVALLTFAFRISLGKAGRYDAGEVFTHRSKLPNFKAYIDQKFEVKSEEDELWLKTQLKWERKEFEAVKNAIGDEFANEEFLKTDFRDEIDSSKLYGLNKSGLRTTDYYKHLVEPKEDDNTSKETKQIKRRQERQDMKDKKIWVGSLAFMDVRKHGEW